MYLWKVPHFNVKKKDFGGFTVILRNSEKGGRLFDSSFEFKKTNEQQMCNVNRPILLNKGFNILLVNLYAL